MTYLVTHNSFHLQTVLTFFIITWKAFQSTRERPFVNKIVSHSYCMAQFMSKSLNKKIKRLTYLNRTQLKHQHFSIVTFLHQTSIYPYGLQFLNFPIIFLTSIFRDGSSAVLFLKTIAAIILPIRTIIINETESSSQPKSVTPNIFVMSEVMVMIY